MLNVLKFYPVSRKPGRDGWWTRVYDPQQRRASWRKLKGATTRRQAELQLQQLIRDNRRQVRSVRLEAAIEEWKGIRFPRLTTVTRARYGAILKRWVGAFGAARFVSSITIRDVEVYHVGLRARGLGPSTTNLERLLLKAFFAWAAERRLIDGNPARTLTPEDAAPRRARRVLDPDELARLLVACRTPYTTECRGFRNAGSREGRKTTRDPRAWRQEQTPPPWLYPLTLLASRTLLRLESLRQLRWEFIDLDEEMMRIPGQVVKNRRPLQIPLSADALEVLRTLKADRPSEGPSPLVFDGLPDSRAVARAIGNAARRAKISGRVGAHTLRATAATTLLRSGMALETVMVLGGWSSPAVLIRHYRKVGDDELREAVARLDGGRGRKRRQPKDRR